jgi:two-component system, cell cycle response regulator
VPRRTSLSTPPPLRGDGADGRKSKGRQASLVVVYGTELGRRIVLDQTSFTIGRSSRRDLFIDEEAVSRKHAEIARSKGQYSIYDLRSRNGTRVNDVRVTERVLVDGDRIQIGQTILAFLSGPHEEARYQEELYRLLTIDVVTGAYNRRYFGDALEREHARALRYARPLSIVLFDVDALEPTLAQQGREAVDAVLRQLIPAIRGKLREQDILGRLGDESFGILLPEVDLPGAISAAERVRFIAERTDIRHEELVPLRATVSAGVASLSASETTAKALLALARIALADAKNSGVNGLGVSRNSTCPP